MKYFTNWPLNDKELKAGGYISIGHPGLVNIDSTDVLRDTKIVEDYAKEAIRLANGEKFEYNSFIIFCKDNNDYQDFRKAWILRGDSRIKDLVFLIIQPLKKIEK